MTDPTSPALTESQLAELERLEREATSGPWLQQDDDSGDVYWVAEAEGLPLVTRVVQFENHEDESLLLGLRNAAPALLSAARRSLALDAAIRDAAPVLQNIKVHTARESAALLVLLSRLK